MANLKTFGRGGVHPAENKITALRPVEHIGMPDELLLALSQHIGAPARPIVAAGEHVERGQMIAEAGGHVSAPVHAPVSGTITKITRARNPQGVLTDVIVLKPDAEAIASEPTALYTEEPGGRPLPESRDEALAMVREAGIVGLGGATFPAHVKLTPPPGKNVDVLLLNGAECEPWLTNDHALMLGCADTIIDGILVMMKAAGVERAVIGIENNKADAIRHFKQTLQRRDDAHGITVEAMRVKYPQGSEKHLIKALTGREVPSGGLPADAGAIVQNVATAWAVGRAARHGEPLTARVVTVSGKGVKRPGNYMVPLGTPLRHLLAFAGGLPDDCGKLIAGGPMMGRAVAEPDSFTTKGLSGLIAVPEREAHRREPSVCIRCASCVGVCPMGLEPYLLSRLSQLGMTDEASEEKIMNCIECGSCSYICPAWLPLLDNIRTGKNALRRKQQANKTK